MGAAGVPMNKEPPAFTVTVPPTMVRLLLTMRLAVKVPLMVVVEAVAVVMSTVTVCPAWMVTGVQTVGTWAGLQVAAIDQFAGPAPALAKAAQGLTTLKEA